jgi:hypothetical protein
MGITSLEGIQSVDDVHSPGQALALAGALLARAGALVDFGASVRQTEDLAVTAVTVAEQAKAVAADRVAEAHRAGAPRRRSCRSMGVLLGDRLATDSAAMAPYATLGLWLGDFCDFAAAWQLGRITDAHVRLLRQLDTPLTHALLQRDQDFLLGHAAVLSWDDFVTACRYWLNCANPDGTLPSERERSYGTTTKTHANGDVEIRTVLDPIAGEAALTALEHEDQKLFRQSENDPDAAPELVRMNSRRRKSIALLNLLTRGFQRADGSFPTPMVNIVMSEKVAERLLTSVSEPDEPIEFDLAWDDMDRRCETIRGVPIHPRKARTALLLGTFRRQVFKPDGIPASYTKPARLFDEHQKQTLLVAARGRCQHVGCSSPWITLQADHKRPSVLGGLTNLLNGQILCEWCNKWKRDRLL